MIYGADTNLFFIVESENNNNLNSQGLEILCSQVFILIFKYFIWIHLPVYSCIWLYTAVYCCIQPYTDHPKSGFLYTDNLDQKIFG